MILLIDNYDSFTYNLYQQISMHGKEVMVVRNDAITIEEIELLSLEAIVLSPGPGNPSEAGICIELVQKLYQKLPIIGICLGHQAIGSAFGANIISSQSIKHGKQSFLGKDHFFKLHDGPIKVMRYHSLIIEETSLPKEFEILARADDDQEIMAIKHVSYPLYGLQFHPESIGTEDGDQLIKYLLEEMNLLAIG